MAARGALPAAFALSVTTWLAACTSLLGDFTVTNEPPGSGLDASLDLDGAGPGEDGGGKADGAQADGKREPTPGPCFTQQNVQVAAGDFCTDDPNGQHLPIPTPPKGRCKFGTWVCYGNEAVCEGAVAPSAENCDTTVGPDGDEDCDGNPTTGCPPCKESSTRPCGRTAGICVAGTETCIGGEWKNCSATPPNRRNCAQAVDNDCNGEVDNAEAACKCGGIVAVGGTQPCNEPGSLGECAKGTQTCQVATDPSQVVFGACTSNVTPAARNCASTLDHDCDGILDYRESGCACRTAAAVPTTSRQVFAQNMHGCAGTSTFPSRAGLCNPLCKVCSAAEWVARHGAAAPNHHYWTNDVLKYSTCAVPTGCVVSTTSGTDCDANTPMRVCMGALACGSGATDVNGNTCNWNGCGLDSTANQYFGGCNNNTTAGTLCCCD